MPDRMVVLPPTLFSPRTIEAVPSNRALLDRLREEFEVDVYRWPYMKGSRKLAPTWGGETAALRMMLGEGCHVLSIGGTAALAIIAVSQGEGVASFTCDGMFPPSATLRHLGLRYAAEAAEVTIRASRGGMAQYVRFLMPEGTDAEVASFTRLMDEDIDWQREHEHATSYARLDLMEERPEVQAPTLCLLLPIPIAGYDEDAAILRRFAPRAVVEPTEPWAFNDTAAGTRVADRVIRFAREAGTVERPN